jgi:hypothetical protein
MTEQSTSPHQSNTKPRKSFPYEVLVLIILLVAVIATYTRIFRQGLIPTSALPPKLTETGMPADETSQPGTLLNGDSSSVITSTLTPFAETLSTETPGLTQTPAAAIPSAPSLTPAFGSCQYTLKSGPRDFLYAIYWNWHIDKNIPDLNDYYARIYCAPLLSNTKCDYLSDDPDTTQPGWILILPGVTTNNCYHYGGTPVP